MKKLIAVILTAAMLLGCTAALAENAERTALGSLNINGDFDLVCDLPEGYTLTQLDDAIWMIAKDDPTAPGMMLSIGFDELLSDLGRLNDADEETLAAIEATFREEDEVEITYAETAHGTKLMVVRETLEAVDYVDFYTVYEGYSIEFILFVDPTVEGYTGLSDEQIQMAIDFLSNLDFVPAAAAEEAAAE